ncbi:hypothetical protein FOZ63_029963 [Perkinsus olseni]|uniref:Uncharacterized protein n=1 Tax=Perkinsus olseni TaxID=32597 RepID=A0A7J6PW41_PEROL|nr:hypothetical protein FOZ63_029963 [Perkinsus olseni]KAF4734452.1 hypothetical protein FOZ62_031788 [Perkinsus olseni]
MRAPCSLLFLYLFKPVEGSSTERSKSAKPFVTADSLPAGTYRAAEQNGTICPELPRLVGFEMVVTNGWRGQLASFNAEVLSMGSSARHESIRDETRAALVWYAARTTSPLRRLGPLRLKNQPACFHVDPRGSANRFLDALYAQLQLKKASQFDRDLIICHTELGLIVGLGVNRKYDHRWESTDYGLILEPPSAGGNQFVAAPELKTKRLFQLPYGGPLRELAPKKEANAVYGERRAQPVIASGVQTGHDQLPSNIPKPLKYTLFFPPSTGQERVGFPRVGAQGDEPLKWEFPEVTFGQPGSLDKKGGPCPGAGRRSSTARVGPDRVREGTKRRLAHFLSSGGSSKFLREGKGTSGMHVGADWSTSSVDVWNSGVRCERAHKSFGKPAEVPLESSESARRGTVDHAIGTESSTATSADDPLLPVEFGDLRPDSEARSDDEWVQAIFDSGGSIQSAGNTAEHHHEMDGGRTTEDERQRGYAESHQEGADEVSFTSPSIPDGRYIVTDTGLDEVNMVTVSIRTDYPPHRRWAQLIFHIRGLECPMTLPEVTAGYSEGCLQLDFSNEDYELDLIILRDTLGFADISPNSFRICDEADGGWSLMFDAGNNGASGKTVTSTVKLKLLGT